MREGRTLDQGLERLGGVMYGRVRDLNKFSIDQRCVSVDTMVEMYERVLSELLDKHATLKI